MLKWNLCDTAVAVNVFCQGYDYKPLLYGNKPSHWNIQNSCFIRFGIHVYQGLLPCKIVFRLPRLGLGFLTVPGSKLSPVLPFVSVSVRERERVCVSISVSLCLFLSVSRYVCLSLTLRSLWERECVCVWWWWRRRLQRWWFTVFNDDWLILGF